MKIASTYISAIVAILLLAACGFNTSYVRLTTEESDKIKKLAVIVEGNPEFSYIDESTKLNLGAAYVFGLLGYLAAHSADEAHDNEVAKSITPLEIELSGRNQLINNIVTDLENTNRYNIVKIFESTALIPKKNEFDAVAIFNINAWGARIHQGGTGKLIDFIDVSVKLKRFEDDKIIWNDKQVITIETRHSIEEYRNNNELVRKDMDEVIFKSAQRMTNMLVNP